MAGGRRPRNGHVVHGQGNVTTPAKKIRYVNAVDDRGWLKTLGSPANDFVSLCKYTKLEQTGVKAGRTSYKVLDGPNKGRRVSLANANAATYIGTKAPSQGVVAISVVYGSYDPAWKSVARGDVLQQQFATLTVDKITATVTMNSVWGTTFFPLPPADYNVLVPDAPHDAAKTAYYRNANKDLRFDQVWFPVGFKDNSRFVHVGNLSDGCVTVIDDPKWMAIHEAIVSHRDPTGKLTAKLTVSGTPVRAN